MARQNGVDPASRRLETWKEIAAYFSRDQRTVRRWEARGLPVHRIPGSVGATVFAYEAELSAWLNGHSPEAEAENQEPSTPGQARPQSTGSLSVWPVRAGLAALVLIAAVSVFAFHRAVSPAVGDDRPPEARDPQAIALYQAGLYEWQTRTPVGLTHASDDFRRAIARDPDYGQAYAGLANCYNLLREYTTMPPGQAYPRAKAAAERAIALDPSIGEAHAALAFDDFYWSRDIAGARREFLKALALEPRDAAVHHWYATFLMTIREFPQALVEIDAAENLDSESTAILADKGLILFYDGKIPEALALLQRLEQAKPGFFSPHEYLAGIYLARGDDRNFLRELKAAALARHDDDAGSVADAGASGLAAGGRDAMLRAILTAQQGLYARGKGTAYALALTNADLHNDGDTIAYLKTSLSRHETDNVALAVDQPLERLRASPAFQPLLSMAGLASHS